jgi:hypothetical protein
MDEDQPIIRLSPTGADRTPDRSLRAKPTRKKSGKAPANSAEPELRLVDETLPNPPDATVTTLEEQPKRAFFEGKSVEYTIDEIMQPEVTYDPNAIEQEWGRKSYKIPAGWVAVLCILGAFIAYGTYRVIEKNRRAEVRIVETQQVLLEPKVDEAEVLVQSIERTVRAFYAAKTIDEKILHVRHPEAMRTRMEAFYAKHPLEAEPCEMVTNFQPLTLGGISYWKVLALKPDKKGNIVLLEQVSDTRVLVDWDSLVDFQAVPWEQYVAEKPFTAMSFRLEVEESPRYIGEFIDESSWVSYRLTKAKSESILYGYVRRNSATHQRIAAAQQAGSHHLICMLQCSPAMKAKDSVVIQDMVSDSFYRSSPPKSIYD